jgi:hypothetical protein
MLVVTRSKPRPLAPMDLREPGQDWWRVVAAYLAVALVSFALTWVSDFNWPTRTGNLCMILFLAANTYQPAKLLRKHFRFRGVQIYYSWLLRWHCYLNTAAFVAACVHAYTTSWTNKWLWLSLVMMGVLTVGGFLLRFKYQPKVRKGLYVLHTQQIAFLVLLYALLKGHYTFAWLP